MMRRRFTTIAAMSLIAITLSATPAMAGTPAVRGSWSAVGVQIYCGANTYTITEGTVYATERLGTSASGNVSFSGPVSGFRTSVTQPLYNLTVSSGEATTFAQLLQAGNVSVTSGTNSSFNQSVTADLSVTSGAATSFGAIPRASTCRTMPSALRACASSNSPLASVTATGSSPSTVP